MRPEKKTVDYFPHQCKHGKTMRILKNRFGNDGCAFWWTLLEVLGSTEGHCYDCSDALNWEYFISESLIEPEKAEKIMELLSKLEAIDKELWEKRRIIWCQNFIDNLKELYRRRNTDVPERPLLNNNRVNDGRNKVNDGRKPQSRVDKIEEDKKKIYVAVSLLSLFEKYESYFTSDELYLKQAFIEYWTEKNEGGKKERWQMQKVFDVKRRFRTWINNQKERCKNQHNANDVLKDWGK